MKTLTNDFTWSFSRNSTFQECKRKYYYHYYMSWGGWNNNAPNDVKLAYRLKNLTNYYMYKGAVIHDVIEGILSAINAGNKPNKDKFVNWLKEKIKNDWHNSENKLIIQNPKRNITLQEHYYHGENVFKPNVKDEIVNSAIEQFENFLNSEMFNRIYQAKDNWISIEKLDSIIICKTKVWIKIDFLYKSLSNNICIIDWKTGQIRETYAEQLGIYAIYAADNFNLNDLKDGLKKVVGIDVFLREGPNKFRIYKFNKNLIKKSEEFINNSVSEMKNYLKDEQNNKPLSIKNFKRVNESCQGICVTCPYRQICHGVEI